MPYLADTKIAVEFNNITINTDYQLINGVVETSYNPDWSNVVDVKEVIDDFKGLINEIADLFNRADELEKQKAAGTISEEDYNKNWKEIYTGLHKADEQYKALVNTSDIPEDLKKKIADLDPVFVELASNNYTTAGNQNKENLAKTNTTFDEVNKYFSEKCDGSLKSIIAFLATEKVNYLKLLASEVSKNTVSIAESNKIYTASIYDEEKGTLKITHYKGWSISNPVQNLFLIETKDAELNKLKITKFWLSYVPNSIDGYAQGIDVVVYFKDPVPDQTEPFCTQKTTIVKGVSTQAQFADAMEQMVFYGALGLGSVEALGGIKATECITGFTLDAGFQMGINTIVKTYLNEKFTTKQLMKEVSLPSAATSCAIAALVNKCGTGCAGASGFVVGFGEDVLNQLKSGKSLSEVEVSQSTLNGIKQGILNILVQKVVTFGIGKFSAWRGKYTTKQVEDALEDLQVHPEKYGVEGNVIAKNVEDIISKKVLKYITKYDKKLGKTVEYPMYNNVALGKDLYGKLKEFGDKVGANVWTTETDNVFTSMYNLPAREFTGGFEKNIGEVLETVVEKNQGKILFDITNVEISQAIKGGLVHTPDLVYKQKLVTELELQMILRNEKWFDNVIFHENGIILSNSELIEKGINLIK